MNDYTEKFVDRRSGKDRRDWDEYVLKERRCGKDRRRKQERRKEQRNFPGEERRRVKHKNSPSSLSDKIKIQKSHYTLQEVSRITGISPSKILKWIRNKLIKDSEIKRDLYGRRAFSQEDIKKIELLKRYRG